MTDLKRLAGEFAAQYVESGMVVGLGTGSTVEHFLRRLGERIRLEGLSLRGVCTSKSTEAASIRYGIPTIAPGDAAAIDLTVDGADEIDAAFSMIKGGGGALLREKVVASLSRVEVIVVGQNKVVEKLGTTFPLPIEVVPFAAGVVRRSLERFGNVTERMRDGNIYLTDNGNAILDVRFRNGIEDAASLETALDRIPGVVETGLFVGLAHRVVIAKDDGTIEVRDCPRC
ncbi:MAG: ribose-5-phosphate isomerase RpiA [Planctomycetes bacterium]|nr:ribose-5-phosphate isomerase RpiA [Planctomycetota bacterium]